MKRLIYTLGIALSLSIATDAPAQSPLRLNKAARQQKEVKNRCAPMYRAATSERIQPAASERYESTYTTPFEYNKYDAWGNKIEERDGTECLIQTWDNSKGYPILLDNYSYEIYPDGTTSERWYEQRTTLNASGVRTAVESEDYDHITLDAAGHVTATDWVEEDGGGSEGESQTMKWDGDRLVGYKYKYDYVPGASDPAGESESTERYELNNIRIVHAGQPFNAYELGYEDLAFLDYDYGRCRIAFSAEGTHSYKDAEEDGSYEVRINSEVGADGKSITTTLTYGGVLAQSIVITLLDDNGSYTLRQTSPIDDDDAYEETEMFNEYGDCLSYIYRTYTGDVKEQESRLFHQWEYENNRPVKVTTYYGYWYSSNGPEPDEIEMTQETVEVFTAWHDGASISATEAGEARILGATLYTMDGTKVRNLTAEEAQAVDAVAAPRGIYLMVVQTERGIQTRKVVATK